MATWNGIERGFEHMLTRLRADRRAAQEFEHSRAEFFAAPALALAPLAERRHLEWFLLERPSAVLGGIPAHVWKEHLRDEFSAKPELVSSLLESLPGAFEVTALVPGEGLWVRDLFTLGEHPVAEGVAGGELATGDLLVGRLFPVGGGTFVLSPAVTCFRNESLQLAVRRDLEHMRAARRGVLRVQQLELERLFHPAEALATAVPTPQEARAHARESLTALGLDRGAVERVLERVRRAARTGNRRVVTEILNRLAFETGVDIRAAQHVLVELWGKERGPTHPPMEPAQSADPGAALEAFDRGRAAGKDLEQLFRDLERDLGLEEAEEPDEDELLGAPDFPGVVGAMVEEFLWELEREEGPERARTWSILRALGEYGQEIGVFDELGAGQLLDFCGRWLLDESKLTRAEEVEQLLDALEGFCRWSEERHALPLWTQFGRTLGGMRASVGRLLELRRHVLPGAGQGAYLVLELNGGVARVRNGQRKELALSLSVAEESCLRVGDLIRIEQRGGRSALGAAYPPELAALLT